MKNRIVAAWKVLRGEWVAQPTPVSITAWPEHLTTSSSGTTAVVKWTTGA